MNASTEGTRLAALYREAARDIEQDDRMSCCAVTHLVSSEIAPLKCAEAQRYVRVFADAMIGYGSYGWMVGDLDEEEKQDFRVLALCFAAAMVETGDA